MHPNIWGRDHLEDYYLSIRFKVYKGLDILFNWNLTKAGRIIHTLYFPWDLSYDPLQVNSYSNSFVGWIGFFNFCNRSTGLDLTI